MGYEKIGRPVRRVEDKRFLIGKGTYIDDLKLEGMAHAAIVRSVHAHAKILSIDVSAATALPGVLMTLTGEEWVAQGFGSIPTRNPVRKRLDGTPFADPVHHCLAVDRVHHIGEAVVLVVAETRAIARDAAEQVVVEYEELPSVTDPMQAIAPGAPRVWDDVEGNFCVDFMLGTQETVEEAFAKADYIAVVDIVNSRVTAVPMEPRGVLGSYDAGSDRYVLYNSSQNIHSNREIIAKDILKVDPAKLRHLAPDVGGGFGGKNSIYAEPALVLYAAKVLGRPVKWVADRYEAFASDTHGRDQVSKAELALARTAPSALCG